MKKPITGANDYILHESKIEDGSPCIRIMQDQGEAYAQLLLWDLERCMFVESISVREDKRGKGLGKRMLEYIEEIARLERVFTIKLCVKADSWVCCWYLHRGYKYLRPCEDKEYITLEKKLKI